VERRKEEERMKRQKSKKKGDIENKEMEDKGKESAVSIALDSSTYTS
jgi:hypothetical protein